MPLLILFKYLENQMTYRSYYYSDAPQLMTPQLTCALTITIQLVITLIVQCNAYVYESVLCLVPACILSSVFI